MTFSELSRRAKSPWIRIQLAHAFTAGGKVNFKSFHDVQNLIAHLPQRYTLNETNPTMSMTRAFLHSHDSQSSLPSHTIALFARLELDFKHLLSPPGCLADSYHR